MTQTSRLSADRQATVRERVNVSKLARHARFLTGAARDSPFRKDARTARKCDKVRLYGGASVNPMTRRTGNDQKEGNDGSLRVVCCIAEGGLLEFHATAERPFNDAADEAAMPTTAPAIAVFEQTPYWVPELKRRFEQTRVHVQGCRSPRDVRDAVSAGADVVVLVFHQREAACLELLGSLATGPAAPHVIAVASQDNADLEWPARELGAVVFLREHISGEEMARLCTAGIDQRQFNF